MHVLRRKKFPATLFQPTFASSCLTVRAVAISTGVVGDGAMSTASALIAMSAEHGGATPRNGQQHFAILAFACRLNPSFTRSSHAVWMLCAHMKICRYGGAATVNRSLRAPLTVKLSESGRAFTRSFGLPTEAVDHELTKGCPTLWITLF